MSSLRWIVSGIISVAATAALGQTTQPTPATFVGEITGNAVYVRSGAGKEWYPVLKLNTGNRVTVVNEKNGWLAIEAPAGAFSLISDTYVDRTEGGKGIVNGNNVLVYAGSGVPPYENQRYAQQTKLKKGAEVELIEHPVSDGYRRIVPPKGVVLWVSKDFVKPLGDGALPTSSGQPTDAATADGVNATAATAEAVAPTSVSSSPVSVTTSQPAERVPEEAPSGSPATTTLGAASPPAKAPDTLTSGGDAGISKPGMERSAAKSESTAQLEAKPPAKRLATEDIKTMRAAVEQIDKDLTADLQKPLLDRNLPPIIERFRPYAEQSDDDFSRLYAQQRVSQAQRLQANIEAVRTVQDLGRGVLEDRKKFMADRANIPLPTVLTEHGYHVEGELRTSSVYDSPLTPRRFRLVEPSGTVPRTLCYLEFPPEMTLDINEYLGHRVGIKARERRLQAADVDPISVYTVSEIVRLDGSATSSAGTGGPVYFNSSSTSTATPP